MRQFIVLSGLLACTISDGYLTGQISSMVAAQQAGDKDLPLSESEVSWIASTVHATCIIGFALAAVVSEKYGRKRAITILSTPVVVNWIITYFANHGIIFIVARVIVGVFFGGVLSLSILSVAEYTSPNTRGMFTHIVISIGFVTGITISHILGILLHWRTVALLGVIPAGLSAIAPFFWVESPTWLAYKGRFVECKAAFRELHGNSAKTEKELLLLIEVEKSKQEKMKLQKTKPIGAVFKKITTAVKQRYFWKITALTMIIHLYRVSTGGLMINTYTITIVKDITDDTSVLSSVILVDGFLILGTIVSCFLRSKLKTRTLLLVGGSLAALLLFILSGYLYFVPENSNYFPIINSGLLALYIVVLHSGPYPTMESLFGEIFPLDIKAYCLFAFGTIGGLLVFVAIMISLTLFKILHYYGVFFLNGVLSVICLCLLWFYLPETKGRTLQEIELFFKNDNFENIDQLLEGEQTKVLV